MTIELPEHLRTGPMAEAAQKALNDANSMAASSNSVPRISLRGREFRLVANGEEGDRFRDFLDVIILGVEPGPGKMIKTFYAKGYTSGAKEPPTCSSDDGITPSPWVTEKQANQCAQCPKNVFGSGTSPTGKATKACRDSKRIWVKLAAGNNAVGAPGSTPTECGESKKPLADRMLFGLNVTVASLKSFSEHGRVLTGLGQPPAVCVTRMHMLDMEYPQLDFKLTAWLSAADAPIALEQSEKRPWQVFKAAGLALAGGDGPVRSSLPTTLPGVPEHLRTTATTPVQTAEPQGTQTIVHQNEMPSTPIKSVDNKSIDDQIKDW